MKKLITIILILVLAITVLTGCWSRREVEELAITAAIGVDRVEIQGRQKWRITTQVVRPQAIGKKDTSGGGGGGGRSSSVWITSSIGDTIDDAIRNFSTRSPRKLFLAHTKLIVIGGNTARQGVHEFVDFLQRNEEIRLRDWIVITKGEARDLLRIKPSLDSLPANEMVGMFTVNMPEVSKSYVVDLKEFLNRLESSGSDAVATNMVTYDIVSKENAQDELLFEGPLKYVRLQGAAVFKADKLVGFIGDEETMGLLWVNGFMRRGVLNLKLKEKNKDDIAISLLRASNKITPYINGDEITVKIKIKSEGELGEFSHSQEVIPEIPKIEKLYAKRIKEQINMVVKKAQSKEYQADIFSFGDAIHRKYPKIWRDKLEKDWKNKYFSKVKVVLDVEAKIRSTGMISNPIEPK